VGNGGFVCLKHSKKTTKAPRMMPGTRGGDVLPYFFAQNRKDVPAKRWSSLRSFLRGDEPRTVYSPGRDFAFVSLLRQNGQNVFIDKRGRALRYIAVKETFDRLVGKAGITSRSGRPAGGGQARRPRLHDLRHTFAVRALQGSPSGRSRCGPHLVALATYMGHVNIYATYWYLEATADLMRDVAVAGEAFMSEGRSA